MDIRAALCHNPTFPQRPAQDLQHRIISPAKIQLTNPLSGHHHGSPQFSVRTLKVVILAWALGPQRFSQKTCSGQHNAIRAGSPRCWPLTSGLWMPLHDPSDRKPVVMEAADYPVLTGLLSFRVPSSYHRDMRCNRSDLGFPSACEQALPQLIACHDGVRIRKN